MDTLSFKTVSVNKQNANKEWVVIDATDQVLGRLCTRVAKMLRGKYKPIILYCLMEYEPVRFNEMQRYLGRVADKTLSQNLKELERDGLIHRRMYPEVPPRVEYQLTEIGRTFVPVLASIRSWGEQYIAYLHAKNHSENKDAVQEEKAQ